MSENHSKQLRFPAQTFHRAEKTRTTALIKNCTYDCSFFYYYFRNAINFMQEYVISRIVSTETSVIVNA